MPPILRGADRDPRASPTGRVTIGPGAGTRAGLTATHGPDGRTRPGRLALATIQITGGRIIDPSQGLDRVGDLWISRGRILPMGGSSEEADLVIDARGLI